MCRGHDDEPGDTRHDDAAESDGRTATAGRFAAIADRLLTGNACGCTGDGADPDVAGSNLVANGAFARSLA